MYGFGAQKKTEDPAMTHAFNTRPDVLVVDGGNAAIAAREAGASVSMLESAEIVPGREFAAHAELSLHVPRASGRSNRGL